MTDSSGSTDRTTVRQAVPADAALIVHYVKELARFEKEPLENVHLNEDKVREHAFGPTPRFEVLIAERDGAPVGMALFFENYSTWAARPGIWIEELFVEESFRGQGVGRALLASLARLATERGCGRVELAALDWNPATAFYRRLRFEQLDEWRIFRLTGGDIDELAADAGV